MEQLKKADKFWHQRREIAAYYQRELGKIEELELPPGDSKDVEHSWHLFILRLRSGLLNINRDEFIEELKEAGIGTSVHFIPLHRHPYYVREFGYKPEDFPQADANYVRSLSIPIFPDMTMAQQKRVVDSVARVVEKNRKRTAVVVG